MNEEFVIGRAGVLDLEVPQVEISWDIFSFTHSCFLSQPPFPSFCFLAYLRSLYLKPP